MADEQIGPWVHGIVKAPDKGISGGLIKIDHDIAAENDIEFETEADRLHQIEGTEYHVVPDGLGDTVEPPCPLPLEISLEPGVGHVSGWLVDAGHGLGQGLLRDVSGQHPGIPLGGPGAKKFLKTDGKRVGLFSAGAASAPDGEHLVPLMLCGELGEDLILKIGEVILFTEKKRVIGSELVQHQLQVRRITGWKTDAPERCGNPYSPAPSKNGRDGC